MTDKKVKKEYAYGKTSVYNNTSTKLHAYKNSNILCDLNTIKSKHII